MTLARLVILRKEIARKLQAKKRSLLSYSKAAKYFRAGDILGDGKLILGVSETTEHMIFKTVDAAERIHVIKSMKTKELTFK
ncbi:hypothetical protein [Halobacillus halophilus]|uniref:hypothetical protein n=1 Tax=Halobacillus halophilus TaxID=1570 RepID=UPI0002E113A5|nr:hypothetical protein [Halobacillus halophilus]